MTLDKLIERLQDIKTTGLERNQPDIGNTEVAIFYRTSKFRQEARILKYACQGQLTLPLTVVPPNGKVVIELDTEDSVLAKLHR